MIEKEASSQNLLGKRKEQVSSLVFLLAYSGVWLKVPKYEDSIMGSLNSSVSGTNVLSKFSPDVLFAKTHFSISDF